MHESKVLTYPSGSMLIRAALKKQEIWVFESKSIFKKPVFEKIEGYNAKKYDLDIKNSICDVHI